MIDSRAGEACVYFFDPLLTRWPTDEHFNARNKYWNSMKRYEREEEKVSDTKRVLT